MQLNGSINKKDKFSLFIRAGLKLVRGTLRKPFLRRSKGLLFVGKQVTISHAGHISCGKNVKFEDYSEIHGLCSDGLSFGDNVTIGRGTMIRPSSYYGIDLGYGLTMGENSSIGPHGYVGCSGPITIGKNVMFGPKCSLFAENHVFSDCETDIKTQGVSRRGIEIGDNCWIGSNVVILDGVRIGGGCVIGAGTLVSKDVPPHTVLIDKRAKSARSRSPLGRRLANEKRSD